MATTTRNELRGFLNLNQSTSDNPNSTGQTSGRDARTKGSRRSRKECVSESLEHDDDELVKFMSKLPSYLKRMERGGGGGEESNVLNVGVLDWDRLEKWKQSRGRLGERSGKTARKLSSSVATSSGLVVPNESHRCKIDDDELHICSNPGKGKGKGRGTRDLEHSVCGVRCTLEPELASRDMLNKEKIATCGYNKSSGKSRRSRSYQESTSEMGNSGGSMGAKGNIVVRDKRAGEVHAQEARESGKQCVEKKLDAEEKIIEGDSNIVLLRSRKQSRSILPGEPQMSVAREDNRSFDFSNGIDSSLGSRSQVPWSCPLSLDFEKDPEDTMLPLGGRRRSKTASRIFDQELREDESRKNRQTSPSKRFSFSFGRLSKSFSSKDDSSAGQLFSSSDDTIKSDSTRFDGSTNPEKQNGSRVSPLRRLLDPILKSKGSENVLQAKPSNSKVPPRDEKKPDSSRRSRALFQLTVRNGIPLFQFMVEDDNNSSSKIILGGTMKNSTFLKDDAVQYCTFYSVNEVKKKKSGSWLIHGHKEKQLGFVYNVIGQMQMSNSTLSSVIRESVLFEESEKFNERKEVAAVVIKRKPVEEYYTGLEETTVIIPGGVHSFPEKGAPSPLVSRWRTGGLCDCGGWDVGCKLHVFSNKTFLREFDKSFKLFDQELSEQGSGPVLAMKEVKTGMYSVEFGSFLSALQAFFVCVTVITCGNGEEDRVAKTTPKSSSPFAPPLSPVGRV